MRFGATAKDVASLERSHPPNDAPSSRTAVISTVRAGHHRPLDAGSFADATTDFPRTPAMGDGNAHESPTREPADGSGPKGRTGRQPRRGGRFDSDPARADGT